MSISTPPVNKNFNLYSYQHNYDIDENDGISDNEELDSFTKTDINLPQILVPAPMNSPFADAISPSTMNFMAVLAENNHPSFIELYMDEWTAAKKDFAGFIDTLGHELYTDIDEDTSWKNIKVMVRQSFRTDNKGKMKDYHTSLQTSFKQITNVKSLQFGYFISVGPGNQTTVSVGMAFIPTAVMDEMRYIVLKEGHLLGEVLSTEYVRQVFGTDVTGTHLLDTTSRLRHVPDDFPAANPNSDLLKFNHFLVTKRFDDIDVVSSGFMDKVLDVYAALAPFMDLLCEWEINLTHRLGKFLLYNIPSHPASYPPSLP